MSNIKELIRAEIRKWQSNIEARCPESTRSRDYTKEEWDAIYEYNAYTRILSFLDTLPDECVANTSKTFSEDLEEAAEEYATTHLRNNEFPTADSAFRAGAEWMKRKMMEGAVEGEVCILPGHVAYVKEKNNESLKQYLLNNFKAGDEVRIIILPNDEDNDRTIV